MAKFNVPKFATGPPLAPMRTTAALDTYEGGKGYEYDARTQLYLTGVTFMVGADTFYEDGAAKQARFVDLVHKVAVEDPEWMLGFLPWLRTEAFIRSASLVAAAEALRAHVENDIPGYGRRYVGSVLARPDEPGEMLAYWFGTYGRKLPQPFKRGVADAARRLYTEKAFLKYDSTARGIRFADVIELTHPKPKDERQSALFHHILNARHGRGDEIPTPLLMLDRNRRLMQIDPQERRGFLVRDGGLGDLVAAGVTWEQISGWLGGPMDAGVWSALLPTMGTMAVIRNLRNVDRAEVPDEVVAPIAAKLATVGAAKAARIFPYRVYTAYQQAPSMRWSDALEKLLRDSCENLPVLPGRTLVLVDTSASMTQAISGKSVVRHVDAAALFGIALASRGNKVDLFGYADESFSFPVRTGDSVLRRMEEFARTIGKVGHGTQTVRAIRNRYDGQDRVVVITDGQAFLDHSYGAPHGPACRCGSRSTSVSESVPEHVPAFGIDTTGYSRGGLDLSSRNRYAIGGFSDASFTVIDLLCRGRDALWPWETAQA